MMAAADDFLVAVAEAITPTAVTAPAVVALAASTEATAPCRLEGLALGAPAGATTGVCAEGPRVNGTPPRDENRTVRQKKARITRAEKLLLPRALLEKELPLRLPQPKRKKLLKLPRPKRKTLH